MPHAFVHRFERFSAGVQIVLGVLAFAIALPLGLLIPSALLSVLVTFFVLTPLSILLVVAVASSVQRARNTVKATELDTVLSDARQVHHDVPPPSLTPAWKAALTHIGERRGHVRNVGYRHCQGVGFIALLRGSNRSFLALLNGKPEQALVEEELRNLVELRAKHSGVDTARDTLRVLDRIYDLVGKAVTGVDVDAMEAFVELDRDFVPFTDCQVGHWNVHNLTRVYTAVGGQRRVERACSCGSRWSEKI